MSSLSPTTVGPRPRAPAGLVAACAVCAALVAFVTPSRLEAQTVRMPRIGQQFGTVGATLQPGFLYDPNAPSDRRWSPVAATGAGTLRFGFHQIVAETFIMSAEADVALQWLNEHTAAPTGRADSEIGFAWQVGLVGRWLVAGERAGWMLGGGPHWYNAYLDASPVQSLGVDLRAGRYLWQTTESFVLLEVGYAIPVVQGLVRGTTAGGGSNRSPKSWTFHRFSVSLQYGF